MISPQPRLYLHPDRKHMSIGFAGENDTLLRIGDGPDNPDQHDVEVVEALMDDDWFETSSYVLCPDCTVKACRAYANTLAPSSLPTITTTPDAQT